MQASIREMFPQVDVIVKPISTTMDAKVHHYKVDQGAIGSPTVIDHQMKVPKIGAFEVQLYTRDSQSGQPLEKVLHSKIVSGNWPSVSSILQSIHAYLPKVPTVIVQLFSEDSSVSQTKTGKLSNISVSIQPNFKSSTVSHKQLASTLLTME